jgi:hypothetical protein
MLTFERAKTLKPGEVLVTEQKKRWRVNGQVHLWKTMPDRIKVPLKHGLYAYDHLTEKDFVDGVCPGLTIEGESNGMDMAQT